VSTLILQRLIACCLALLLLFGGTAKEALHAFAPHEDTEHCQDFDGLSFESEHHHCGALSAFIAAFETPAPAFFVDRSSVEFALVSGIAAQSLLPRKVQAYGLRGPPVV
jgi:hypothetical protein